MHGSPIVISQDALAFLRTIGLLGPGGAPEAGGGLTIRIRDAVAVGNRGDVRVSLRLLENLEGTEWNAALPRDRYRMLAAIGFARLVLDGEASAASTFRAAYAADPDHPGSCAVLALAQQLSGEREGAFGTARRALAEDPSSQQAAAVLAGTAARDLALSELRGMIPSALLSIPDVLLSLVMAARARLDHRSALELAEDAYARAPEDWRTCATLAEELLEPVFENKAIAVTKAIPAKFKERFLRGLGLLQKAWGQVRKRDHARLVVHIAANLAAALDVSGDEAGARLIIGEGLDVRPDDRALLRRRATALALRDEWPAVCETLSGIPAAERKSEDWMLDAKALLMRGALEDARRIVVQELEGALRGSREQELAEALALEIALAAGEGASAITAAWDAHPDSIILRSAGLPAAQVDGPLRERLLADVLRIASVATDARDRTIAADTLAALGEHSLAADMFGSLDAPLDRDTQVLSGRLRALILADRRQEARRLFESIAVPVRQERPYRDLGIHLYERIGMLTQALQLAEKHLALEPADLRARLAWIDLCGRIGREARVRAWLSDVPSTVTGTARELMTLARLVDDYLGDEKCLRIGYRALRHGYDDPAIHAAYALGLFVMGKAAQAGIPHPEQVGPDAAVTLESLGGGDDVVRIIETEPEPRSERDEVTARDAFASRLLGLKVGDEMEVPSAGGEPRRFRVKSIESKLVFAQRRSLAEFHRRFPASQAFSTLRIDASRGEEGIEPILQATRRRAEHVNELVERYRTGGLPLAFAARMAGSSVFDAWDGLRAARDVPLLCSQGTQQESEQVADRLKTAELYIIDPLIPYSAAALGITGILHAASPRLGITQSTRDLLQQLVEERRSHFAGGQRSLSWNGDRYVLHEMGENEMEARIAVAQDALAFAMRCELVPAEAPSPLPPEALRVYGHLPPAFLDVALAAQGNGRLLLSDDFALRCLTEQASSAFGTWSQAVLQHGMSHGRISPEDYRYAIARLAIAGYSYLRLGAQDILAEFRLAGWQESDVVCELLRRLALPGNEPASVQRVVGDLLLLARQETSMDGRFERLATALGRQFEESQREGAVVCLNAVLRRIEATLRADAWNSAKGVWLRTTSLVQPWTVTDPVVVGRAEQVACRIRAALAAGLTKPSRLMDGS